MEKPGKHLHTYSHTLQVHIIYHKFHFFLYRRYKATLCRSPKFLMFPGSALFFSVQIKGEKVKYVSVYSQCYTNKKVKTSVKFQHEMVRMTSQRHRLPKLLAPSVLGDQISSLDLLELASNSYNDPIYREGAFFL